MVTIYSWILKLTVGLMVVCGVGAMAARSVSLPTRELTFVGYSITQPGVYFMDVTRGLLTRYIKHPVIGRQSNFTWSPDQSMIAFRAVFNITIDLYAVDINGENRVRLTENGKNNHSPAWSPDGRWIAYTSEQDNNAEIYILDASCVWEKVSCNGHSSRVTEHPAVDDVAAWSPDSQWLAFQSKRDGDYEIYVVDVSCVAHEGGCEDSIVRLTEQIGRDILPAWSPDGQMIAFTSERDGNAELYTMSLESGSVRRLTDSPEHEFSPLWSPDGEQLLFQRTVAGSDLETFVMDMESGAIRRLTTVDMFLQNPSWRPS